MKKQLLCIILTAALLFTLVPAASAVCPFTDVSQDAWYYRTIETCCLNGWMNGVSKTEFQPGTQMSRAMLVTVLYRTERNPATGGSIPFADVPSDAWFTDAVVWAYGIGIIKGTSPTTFCPDSAISREEMVTIFYRYAQAMDHDTSGLTDLSEYTDVGKISDWALDAMVWAVASRILHGVGGDKLDPKGISSRAECAEFTVRFSIHIGSTLPIPPEPASEPPVQFADPTLNG